MSEGICRCRVCNAVNNAEIATNPGDYTTVRFYEDDLGYICYYCNKAIGESLVEFEDEEDDAWTESDEMD